jgi:hypothetical protein
MKNTVLVLGLVALLSAPAFVQAEIIVDQNGVKMEDQTPITEGNVVASVRALVPFTIQLDKEFNRYYYGTGEPPAQGIAALVKVTLQPGASFILSDEIVTNNTRVDWLDFHIVIIPDIGTVDVEGDLVLGTPFASCSMSSPPPTVDFFDGIFKVGDSHLLFQSDAQNPIVFTNPSTSSVATFYIKEWPTVPEPATMGLLSLGGLAGLVLRRRRK